MAKLESAPRSEQEARARQIAHQHVTRGFCQAAGATSADAHGFHKIAADNYAQAAAALLDAVNALPELAGELLPQASEYWSCEEAQRAAMLLADEVRHLDASDNAAVPSGAAVAAAGDEAASSANSLVTSLRLGGGGRGEPDKATLAHQSCHRNVTRGFQQAASAGAAGAARYFRFAADRYAAAAASLLDAMTDLPDLAEVLMPRANEFINREGAMRAAAEFESSEAAPGPARAVGKPMATAALSSASSPAHQVLQTGACVELVSDVNGRHAFGPFFVHVLPSGLVNLAERCPGRYRAPTAGLRRGIEALLRDNGCDLSPLEGAPGAGVGAAWGGLLRAVGLSGAVDLAGGGDDWAAWRVAGGGAAKVTFICDVAKGAVLCSRAGRLLAVEGADGPEALFTPASVDPTTPAAQDTAVAGGVTGGRGGGGQQQSYVASLAFLGHAPQSQYALAYDVLARQDRSTANVVLKLLGDNAIFHACVAEACAEARRHGGQGVSASEAARRTAEKLASATFRALPKPALVPVVPAAVRQDGGGGEGVDGDARARPKYVEPSDALVLSTLACRLDALAFEAGVEVEREAALRLDLAMGRALGLTVREVNPDSDASALLVTGVDPAGQSCAKGARIGYFLREINGVAVNSLDAVFRSCKAARDSGAKRFVVVLRSSPPSCETDDEDDAGDEVRSESEKEEWGGNRDECGEGGDGGEDGGEDVGWDPSCALSAEDLAAFKDKGYAHAPGVAAPVLVAAALGEVHAALYDAALVSVLRARADAERPLTLLPTGAANTMAGTASTLGAAAAKKTAFGDLSSSTPALLNLLFCSCAWTLAQQLLGRGRAARPRQAQVAVSPPRPDPRAGRMRLRAGKGGAKAGAGEGPGGAGGGSGGGARRSGGDEDENASRWWSFDGMTAPVAAPGQHSPYSLLVAVALSPARMAVYAGGHAALQPLVVEKLRSGAGDRKSGESSSSSSSSSSGGGGNGACGNSGGGIDGGCDDDNGFFRRDGSQPTLGGRTELALAPGDVVLLHPKLPRIEDPPEGGPGAGSPHLRVVAYFRLSHARHGELAASGRTCEDLWCELEGLRGEVPASCGDDWASL